MTTKELIKALENMDPDAEVIVGVRSHGMVIHRYFYDEECWLRMEVVDAVTTVVEERLDGNVAIMGGVNHCLCCRGDR